MRRGCGGHEESRRGAERCRCAEEGRDTAERGGERGREPQAESIGPAAGERGDGAAEYGGAGECGGSNRAMGGETYRRYGEQLGQNGQQTGSSIGMWYSDGAEREVVTGENGRRRRGAALCPSGAARRQGSDLQERRTGRRIQYSDKSVPGSWLMV